MIREWTICRYWIGGVWRHRRAVSAPATVIDRCCASREGSPSTVIWRARCDSSERSRLFNVHLVSAHVETTSRGSTVGPALACAHLRCGNPERYRTPVRHCATLDLWPAGWDEGSSTPSLCRRRHADTAGSMDLLPRPGRIRGSSSTGLDETTAGGASSHTSSRTTRPWCSSGCPPDS